MWTTCGKGKDEKKYLPRFQRFRHRSSRRRVASYTVSLDLPPRIHRMRPPLGARFFRFSFIRRGRSAADGHPVRRVAEAIVVISRAPSYVSDVQTSRRSQLAPSTKAGGGAEGVSAPHGRAQWWFAALDQRCFGVGTARWTAQVVGIHVDGFDVWIQLERAGDPLRSLVLHVRPGMDLFGAVDAIEEMLRRESTR
jgi:hypothetical protein